nr:hypothetical protein [Streptomyces chartreusis]
MLHALLIDMVHRYSQRESGHKVNLTRSLPSACATAASIAALVLGGSEAALALPAPDKPEVLEIAAGTPSGDLSKTTGVRRVWLEDILFPHLCDEPLFPVPCQRKAEVVGRVTIDVMRPDGVGRPGGYDFIVGQSDSSKIDWTDAGHYSAAKYVGRNIHYRFAETSARLVRRPRTLYAADAGASKTGKGTNWVDLPVAVGDVIRFRFNVMDDDGDMGDDNLCVGTRVSAPVPSGSAAQSTQWNVYHFKPGDDTECNVNVSMRSW